MDADDQITTLIAERGSNLSRLDLAEIEFLMTQGDPANAYERMGSIYEAIHLIVADPLYKGDIKMSDLAE